MWAEDSKGWLQRAEAEEKAQKEGAEGLEEAGDTWRLLVRMIWHILTAPRMGSCRGASTAE